MSLPKEHDSDTSLLLTSEGELCFKFGLIILINNGCSKNVSMILVVRFSFYQISILFDTLK